MVETAESHKSADTDQTFQKLVDEVAEERSGESSNTSGSLEASESDVPDHKLKAREGLVAYKDTLEERIESKRGEQEAKVKEKLDLVQREQALDREIAGLESEIGTLRAEVANTDRTITTFDAKVEPVVVPTSSDVDQVVSEAPVLPQAPQADIDRVIAEAPAPSSTVPEALRVTMQAEEVGTTATDGSPEVKVPEKLSDDFNNILTGYNLPKDVAPENNVPPAPQSPLDSRPIM